MRYRSGVFFGLALLPLLAGCRSYGPSFDARQPAGGPAVKLEEGAFASVEQTNQVRPDWLKPPTEFFRLGPGDNLEIEVLGEPTSRSSALVGPDGKIYYNLLPGLFVWGLTLSETKDLLEKELGKQLRVKPEIALTLRLVESRRVWLLGSVQKPGVYPLATPLTVLEAISAAGGTIRPPGLLDGVPDLRRSFLLRDGQMVKVDLHRLLSQGDLTQNVCLRPDDFLYLQSESSRNVYVLGAVPAPSILPYSDRLSLLGALASCGGTLPYAQVSHVAIIRGSLVDPKIATVDYAAIRKGKAQDVLLQEGDIVYVSFVPYRKLALLAEGAVSQFIYAVAYNYGSKVGGGSSVGPTVPSSPSAAPPILIPPRTQ